MQEEIIRLAEDMISGTDEEYWYRRLQWCLKCQNQIQRNEAVDEICRNCEFNEYPCILALGVLIYENEAFKRIIDESPKQPSGEEMAVRLIRKGYSLYAEYIFEYFCAFIELKQAGLTSGLNVSYMANRFLRMFRGEYLRLWIRYLPLFLDVIRHNYNFDDSDVKFAINAIYCDSTLFIRAADKRVFPPVEFNKPY